MPRPNARLEERTNARMDAIAVKRDHQHGVRECLDDVKAAEREFALAQRHLRAAEHHLIDAYRQDEADISRLRAENEADLDLEIAA